MRARTRLTQPLVRRDGELCPATWRRRLTRTTAGLERAREADASRSFGIFSCSKSTNEVNFLASKMARQVFGNNNVDSCNRT